MTARQAPWWEDPEPVGWKFSLAAGLVIFALLAVLAWAGSFVASWFDARDAAELRACFEQASVCEQLNGVWVPVGEDPS